MVDGPQDHNSTPLVLVTGVTGYVGGRLVPRLLEAGFRVRVLLRGSLRDPRRGIRLLSGAFPRTGPGDEMPSFLEHEPDGKITRRRNSRLRYVLIESAWTAVRKDNQLCADYLNLCRRMPKNQAVIRIARKQLARVRFVLKNNQPIEKEL